MSGFKSKIARLCQVGPHALARGAGQYLAISRPTSRSTYESRCAFSGRVDASVSTRAPHVKPIALRLHGGRGTGIRLPRPSAAGGTATHLRKGGGGGRWAVGPRSSRTRQFPAAYSGGCRRYRASSRRVAAIQPLGEGCVADAT